MRRFLVITLVIHILIYSTQATLTPNNKKSKKNPAEVKMNHGPVNSDVFQRGLVDAEPQAANIIAEANTYYRETSLKNFNGTVLGYVTPVSLY